MIFAIRPPKHLCACDSRKSTPNTKDANTYEPLGARMCRKHSHQQMSPSFFEERPGIVSMLFVRRIARAVGSNSGPAIQLRHDQGWSGPDLDQQSCRRTWGGRADEELARPAAKT
jgi:hypothetical protein